MTEEKISRLRDILLKTMDEFFVEQDKLKDYDGKPEKEQTIGLLGWIMKSDDIFQSICELGISGANLRKISSEEIEKIMKEFVETSKELRKYLAQGNIRTALFHLSQFQLLQRKILRAVANVLSPNPLLELAKLEATPIMSKNIFVVHGREDKPKLELARMLEKLGFHPIILSEQPNMGRTIIEKLEDETIDVGYAFVILTPDDLAVPNTLPILPPFPPNLPFKHRARQNVILELGYFVGKIGRKRVCCLYTGDIELPSDIHGVIFKKFNESVDECYKGIVEELKAIGYDIKI